MKCPHCGGGVISVRGKQQCYWCGVIVEGCCEGERPVIQQTTIYVAGPMRHLPWFNFPAFDTARDYLASHGINVISPADQDRARGFDPVRLGEDWNWNELPKGFSLSEVLASCAQHVAKADGLLMLEGWNTSRGAKWEFDFALMLRKPIFLTLPDAVQFARGR